ncbi:MAG: AbrB/MazE/SpoVT family DNA-binding domain-containing protein [Zoogloeaceae bacterium]|jgi:AbrB family looped-hinge helix DNA binding protein|nr:AbrB/MazE/SpoVT family DNA-binding domain-containing protein [Zoogloeaceae bacterium]
MNEIMTVSARGQITLPAAIREKYGIKTGNRIIGEMRGEGFILRKPLDFFALKGVLADGPAIPDDEEELLSEETGRSLLEHR